MDEKRALLAVGISILILVVWYALFPPPKPQPQPQIDPAAIDTPGSTTDLTGDSRGRPSAGERAQSAPATAEPFDASEAIGAGAEERFSLANQHFTAEFTNEGGRLVSFKLNDYRSNGDPLELLPPFANEDQAYLAIELADRDLTRSVNRALFATRRETVTGGPTGGGGERLSFEYSDGTGLEVRKTLTIWAGEWMWEAGLEVIDRGRRIPASLVMGPGFAAQEQRGSRTYYYSNQVLWFDRTGVHRSAEHCGFLFTIACRSWKSAIGKDATPNEATLRGPIRWVGLEDQFFTALAIANTDESEMGWSTREVTPHVTESAGDPPEPAPQPLVTVSVPPEGTRLYFGPKVYSELKVYGVNLEETVWFSSQAWLAAIVRTMYLGLRWLYAHVLANWGVAIILATVTLRVALFPLNQFAMVRMRRTQAEMQKVQPKLKSIRAKYGKKKDATSRQKMNEETMALYKAEGINPMGGVTGCLPMFLQFPILIGFYNMLTVAVELRGAPFILWIKDLSQPDPFFLIPLAMGVTMFAQQKMAMSKVTDPMAQQQQKFMMFMPFMFTFFCLQMPSGMVLYWFINNLLGIGQQQLVNRSAAKLTS